MLVYPTADAIAKSKTDDSRNHELELICMMETVDDVVAILADSRVSMEEFGKLLGLGWKYKRDFPDQVSTPQIDQFCEESILVGAGGGTILGAGVVGFTLLFAKLERSDSIRERRTELVHGNFNSDEHVSEYVHWAAGSVGGIIEKQTPLADFMNANLAVQLIVLKAAHCAGARKLILFVSSCMYPRECLQPMDETALLSRYHESASIAYAISKLAGMEICLAYNQQYGENRFIPLIPNSVYGTLDNFNAKSLHVLAAIIGKFYAVSRSHAPVVWLWDSGTLQRDFIHADDLAEACVMLLDRDTSQLQLPLNVESGVEVSLHELAKMIARIVDGNISVEWDGGRPDGAARKLLDSARLNAASWRSCVNSKDGLRSTYRWYPESIRAIEREETEKVGS